MNQYTDDWPDDDPHANFKREVAEYTRQDPLPTIQRLAQMTGIPSDVLVRYVLVKWAAEGSEALLAAGPRMIERLNQICEQAETKNTDEARLQAYDQLRQILGWLRLPLQNR